jgi:hypothetical protein
MEAIVAGLTSGDEEKINAALDKLSPVSFIDTPENPLATAIKTDAFVKEPAERLLRALSSKGLIKTALASPAAAQLALTLIDHAAISLLPSMRSHLDACNIGGPDFQLDTLTALKDGYAASSVRHVTNRLHAEAVLAGAMQRIRDLALDLGAICEAIKHSRASTIDEATAQSEKAQMEAFDQQSKAHNVKVAANKRLLEEIAALCTDLNIAPETQEVEHPATVFLTEAHNNFRAGCMKYDKNITADTDLTEHFVDTEIFTKEVKTDIVDSAFGQPAKTVLNRVNAISSRSIVTDPVAYFTALMEKAPSKVAKNLDKAISQAHAVRMTLASTTPQRPSIKTSRVATITDAPAAAAGAVTAMDSVTSTSPAAAAGAAIAMDSEPAAAVVAAPAGSNAAKRTLVDIDPPPAGKAHNSAESDGDGIRPAPVNKGTVVPGAKPPGVRTTPVGARPGKDSKK